MNKNIKNKKKIVASLLLLVIFTISACKKDLAQVSPIENAKDWYIKSTRSQGTIISENDRETKITKRVDWDNSKETRLLDGRTVVTAPISVEYSNGTKHAGSFLLIVTKDEGKYSSMVVFDSRNNYFDKNLSTSNLTVMYKNAEIQQKAREQNRLLLDKKKNNKTELKNVPLPTECLDYYWVELWYDMEGNIIGSDEWYLFTVCPTEGGIGGGGNYTEAFVDIGRPSNEDLGVTTSEEVIGVDTFSVANLRWKYHDAITWAATSKEKGLVLKKNGTRTWHSLNHTSNTDEGFWALGTMELYGTPTFTPSIIQGDVSASMLVDYQIKYIVGFSGGTYAIGIPPVKSKQLFSAKTWDVYFNVQE